MIWSKSQNQTSFIYKGSEDPDGVVRRFYYVYQTTPYDWTNEKA